MFNKTVFNLDSKQTTLMEFLVYFHETGLYYESINVNIRTTPLRK